MIDYEDWWEDLAEPFHPDDLEFRVQSGAVKNGKPWAMTLTYVTARAIMNRLDSVVGVANWKNDFKELSNGATLCGISIRVEGEWITKWNGAGDSKEDAEKGAISGAEKRAAVEWGMGRYLYGLGVGFANIHDTGRLKGNVKESKARDAKRVYFNYDPPTLPDWAYPQPLKKLATRFNRKMDRCVTAEEFNVLISVYKSQLNILAAATVKWFADKTKTAGFEWPADIVGK